MSSPMRFEVEGLEAIRWEDHTHAYGSATDVPDDIRSLASSDPEVFEEALLELYGSIYHQGTIYSATTVAVPFLVRLALDRRIPERMRIWELLLAIAESSALDPQKVRETWAWRAKSFGEIYARPSHEMANAEVVTMAAVRGALLDQSEAMRRAADDPEASEVATSLLRILAG